MTFKNLRVLEDDPFNAEVSLAELSEPGEGSLHYVRNHFDVPELDPASWQLTVDGAVKKKSSLSFEDLKRFPTRTLTVTLECAGNGRTLMSPAPGGTPWTHGAVSTATFTGTPVREVLGPENLPPDVEEILFVGADSGPVEEQEDDIPFARSLPLGKALDPDTLLAWKMNGKPLPRNHGFPLRVVVPGWYAMASVKWLTRVSALTEPFQGHFQTSSYVYRGEEGTPDETPVTRIRVRALIARPQNGENVPPDGCTIRGAAWSGHGDVVRVEISDDGGDSWREAKLEEPLSPHAAAPWHVDWTPEETGEHTLLARATDEAGHTQPLEHRWNEGGYGNNAVQRVKVQVRSE